MRARARWLIWVAFASAAVACGTRTGLLVDEFAADSGSDAGVDARTTDAARDARPEASVDASIDAPKPFDASKPDVQIISDCPDASGTLIYLITSDDQLLSFYPPSLTFKTIGTIACPGAGNNGPFSMAVDHTGVAYVVFTDGSLYQVSTANASCKKTSFVPGQQGFTTFGMGFSADQNGDQLYVSQSIANGQFSKGLATIDTKTFKLNFISAFTPPTPRCELTGTGDGRLFAYWPNTQGSGSNIAQIDPKTANVNGVDPLIAGGPNDAFAFAFWGGDFWVFSSTGGPSTVTLFDPVTLKESTATSFSGTIVGAGVSTCAPQ